MTDAMNAVLTTLSGKRFPLTDEKETQASIAAAFATHHPAPMTFAVAREVRIAGGIIDFLVGDCGVEVKLKGAASAIARQLTRYAAEPSISGLVLVTARPVLLGATLGRKPIAVLDLGRAWL